MAETLSKEKTELFETMSIGKAVLKLSVPTVFGCLVMVLYNLADTYFVGMLNSPFETSAVTLVAPVILLFNAVNNLFGVGTASLISRSLGIGNLDCARKTSSIGIWCGAICGLAFSALAVLFKTPLLKLLGADDSTFALTLEYMKWTVFYGAMPAILNVVIGNMVRAEGSALHATIGTISGCVINIILDPFFILPMGLDMGAAGAGLATFISNVIACLYFVFYMVIKGNKTYINFRFSNFRPTKYIMGQIFSVGIPSSIQNILNVTGMTILNNMMSVFGTEAVSAIGISHKLTMLPMYISMGIGQGIMPLIGYNFAAKNSRRMKDALVCTVKISAVVVLILVALFFAFPQSIMTMFMEDAKVVEYGAAFIRGQCLATPFFALDFLAVGVFQACGLGSYALFFAIARKILLEIPALFILNHFFPMYGIAYAQLCAETVLGIAAIVLMRRIIKNSEKESRDRSKD